jgi:uncharacterized membrane protein YgdD (TMEM256/DUF423 family)
MRSWLALAAGYGFAAVALGAFGAHALKARLDADALALWRTAVEYHFWHTLALFGVAILARDGMSRMLDASGAGFAIGIVLFSGSLYALALGAPRGVGAITPLGGVALLIGWSCLLIYALRAS